MSASVSGAAIVAGVVGAPVRHSLSPLLHGAWIAAAGIDAAYVPFAPPEDGFRAFVEGLRGGAIAGLNVTLPFKQDALALADLADPLARAAGAANLLLFHKDGRIEARNTDGPGLLAAFAAQAPAFDPKARPIVVLGAGGAARGAVAALLQAGAPEVRVLNRTLARAEALAADFPAARAVAWEEADGALGDVGAVINATSGGLNGSKFSFSVDATPPEAVVMDMVYKPLRTEFLKAASASGRATVDGLAMLIGQAEPSFEAFFGRPPPTNVDVRGLALKALGQS
ncbi:MAG: shikimate dehydrogenase [Caulobacteraceae bacterium]